MSTALRFDDVGIVRGGRTVVSGVELEIEAGRFVGVLGANGSGKTSLMRAILGLLPISGRITLFGGAIGRGSRAIGYMPQTRAAPTALLTGRALVACALDGHRWGSWPLSRAQGLAVDRALAQVGAEALAPRRLAELSGGERQRLLLAQALLGNPKLLLLDEPLLSLDPPRQAEMVALVRGVCRDQGIAVLFSAHELNPLLGALDQVLYLGGGRARLGSVDAVVTSEGLSQLYGAPVEVVRAGGRIMVFTGAECARC